MKSRNMFHMSFEWQDSKKTIFDCCKQILAVYKCLKEYDSKTFCELVHSGKKMYQLDLTKNDNDISIDIANQFIEEHKSNLKKYTNTKNLCPDMIGEQIGNNFIFWISYEEKHKIGITFKLGAYNGSQNNMSLNLNMNNFEEYNAKWFIDIFQIIIKVLNPYCASFYQYKFWKENLQGNEKSKEFRTGWLLYISKQFCSIELMPSEIENINLTCGKLFITTREKFDKDNSIHVSNALKLKDFLFTNNYFTNFDFTMTEPNPYKESFI